MQLRFLTSVATADRGEFMVGRVITVDTAAPDWPLFRGWLKAGLVEAVREAPVQHAVTGAGERAVSLRPERPARRRAAAVAE